MNTGTVPLDEIRKALKNVALHGWSKAPDKTKYDFWLRSLLEENERITKEREEAIRRGLMQSISHVEDTDSVIDTLKKAKETIESLRSELAAKDKVLELITDLWGLPEIHKIADSILSKYAKEP